MMKYVTFLFTVLAGFLTAGYVFAEATAATGTSSPGVSLAAIGAGMIMALASGLGTLAQSRAAAAALEGIARNPQARSEMFGPLVISLAFMESLVIFAFIIALTLAMK